MIISDCPQRSDQWYIERLGKPSSSRFSEIITTKGDPSKQAKKYLYELVGERLTGKQSETFQSAAMLRGIELEDEARTLYELITGNEVTQIGTCFPDEQKRYCASPDGLVGDDICLEIKCRTLPVTIENLINNHLPSSAFHQCQGQMLITGRTVVHYFEYYPGIKPLFVKVERDATFCAALKKALDVFCKDLDELEKKLRAL